MTWAKKRKSKDSKPKKNKYNATKVEVDGILFDSILESKFYGRLKQLGIPFDFQFEIELMPSYRDYDDKAVRRTYMKVDFVVRKNGVTYFIDTKGFKTEKAILKYKMLSHLIYKTEKKAVVRFVKNQKEIDKMINEIL